MSETLLVNLFAGPGCGKSTTMAGLFAELKWRGVCAEMAPEWIKAAAWDDAIGLYSQQHIFGQQHQMLHRLRGKVDVVVTNSPLVQTLVYTCPHDQPAQWEVVLAEHRRMEPNFNVLLRREKDYDPRGREQTEAEAREIDQITADVLTNADIDFVEYPADRDTVHDLANEVIKRLFRV